MTERDTALVLAAHGSHESPEPRRVTEEHADRIRASGVFEEVREGYWKGTPAVGDAVRATRTEELVVVPLFMSEGYFAGRVIPREVEAASFDGDAVRYTDPVGTHPEVTDVVRSRAEEEIARADDVGLAVVGHGTGRHPDSSVSAEHHAEELEDVFDGADAVFLDEEPDVSSIPERFTTDEVVAVPLFVADGPHATEDVPRAMGISPGFGRDTVEDVEVVYTEPVGTHPDVAELVVERALGSTEENSLDLVDDPSPDEVVRGFPLGPPEADLLPKAEDEGVLSVGEVVVQESDGDSSLEIRHEADLGSPEMKLEDLADPLELREVGERDGDGEYRANRWTEGLDDGWILDELHERETVAALDVLYPGVAQLRSTALEARESSGAEQLASRHPKMYSHLEGSGKAVDATVEQLCNQRCVRHRLWGAETAGDDASSPACVEPCSRFVDRVRGRVEADGERDHEHVDRAEVRR